MDFNSGNGLVSLFPLRPKEHRALANVRINRTRCVCDVAGRPTTFRRKHVRVADTPQPERGNVSMLTGKETNVCMGVCIIKSCGPSAIVVD